MKPKVTGTMACCVCSSTEGVRLFGVCIDGEPLRMQLPLCEDHGDRYLLIVGKAAGEMLRDLGTI